MRKSFSILSLNNKHFRCLIITGRSSEHVSVCVLQVTKHCSKQFQFITQGHYFLLPWAAYILVNPERLDIIPGNAPRHAGHSRHPHISDRGPPGRSIPCNCTSEENFPKMMMPPYTCNDSNLWVISLWTSYITEVNPEICVCKISTMRRAGLVWPISIIMLIKQMSTLKKRLIQKELFIP
jgi:hypothetical protein